MPWLAVERHLSDLSRNDAVEGGVELLLRPDLLTAENRVCRGIRLIEECGEITPTDRFAPVKYHSVAAATPYHSGIVLA